MRFFDEMHVNTAQVRDHHIAGIDIVRVNPGKFYVLEDNRARRPASPTCWRTARS
jgi:uncharacterized circularly permuted ATP-grasp superfamily protein